MFCPSGERKYGPKTLRMLALKEVSQTCALPCGVRFDGVMFSSFCRTSALSSLPHVVEPLYAQFRATGDP